MAFREFDGILPSSLPFFYRPCVPFLLPFFLSSVLSLTLETNSSPLHYAVMSGNAAVVEAMVEAGLHSGRDAAKRGGDVCGEGIMRMGYSSVMGLAVFYGWDLPNSWRILVSSRDTSGRGHST